MSAKSAQEPAPSTFGERFQFARVSQQMAGTWQEDQELADLIGVQASQISEYKRRVDAPPGARVLAIARIVGAKAGWLNFGEAGDDPAPEGFATWLRNYRERRNVKNPVDQDFRKTHSKSKPIRKRRP